MMQKRVPKYKKVAEELFRRIQDELKGGDMLPSQQSIANEFGCSQKSVFRAMEYLKTFGVVRSLPNVGNFVIRPLQKKDRQKPFLILYPGALNHPCSIREEILLDQYEKYILEKLHFLGCRIRKIDPRTITEGTATREAAEGVDGFLFPGTNVYFSQEAVNFIWELNKKIPGVIFRNTCLLDIPCPQITIDHNLGYRMCLEKAVKYRLTGCVCFHADNPNNKNRYLLFRKNAMLFGYHDIQSMEITNSGNPFATAYSMASVCKHKLIFVASDMLSPEILRAFIAKGMKPSIDFHLFSYDDVEGLNYRPFSESQITSISYDRKKICDMALAILLRSLRKEENPDFNSIQLIRPTLIIRKSAFSPSSAPD